MPGIQSRLSGDDSAEIRPYAGSGSEYQLFVNGVAQSHVDLSDPSVLLYEYASYVGRIMDVLHNPPEKILHMGAGALTLPRYIAWRYPESCQVVVELYADLYNFVLRELPLGEGSKVDPVFGDARQLITQPKGILAQAFDLLIADVFHGAQTPKHLTSVPFFRLCFERLSDDGLLLLNLPVDGGTSYARASIASLLSLDKSVGAVLRPAVLAGESKGHIVAFATTSRHSTWIVKRLSAMPQGSIRVLAGADLRAWVGGAQPITDESAGDADGSVLGLAQAVRDRRRQRHAYKAQVVEPVKPSS